MRLLLRIVAAGHALLVVLGLAWAVFERPAPVINVAWREGLSAEDRMRAERELDLGEGRQLDDHAEYEVWSPRRANLRAIIEHPDVEDTHHLDRARAAVSPDAGGGRRRVWWAGPFRGRSSALQFRIVFGAIFAVTLGCWWMAGGGHGSRTGHRSKIVD